MKEKKIVIAAKAAKAEGYTHMVSIVKRVYNTTYYHVVSIDEIIDTEKWSPAPRNHFGWKGRIGVTWKHVPLHTIFRQNAIARYCK